MHLRHASNLQPRGWLKHFQRPQTLIATQRGFVAIESGQSATPGGFAHAVDARSAFPAVDLQAMPNRQADTIDTFADYSYRNDSNPACQISSLDLHRPFAPLCAGRDALLDAMSGGGRVGFETPFMPRGCDMRWFTTDEICEIFSRFEKVVVVGDSMMRHVVGALNVLLRKDLGYGAVTGWNFDDAELSVPTTATRYDSV